MSASTMPADHAHADLYRSLERARANLVASVASGGDLDAPTVGTIGETEHLAVVLAGAEAPDAVRLVEVLLRSVDRWSDSGTGAVTLTAAELPGLHPGRSARVELSPPSQSSVNVPVELDAAGKPELSWSTKHPIQNTRYRLVWSW